MLRSEGWTHLGLIDLRKIRRCVEVDLWDKRTRTGGGVIFRLRLTTHIAATATLISVGAALIGLVAMTFTRETAPIKHRILQRDGRGAVALSVSEEDYSPGSTSIC